MKFVKWLVLGFSLIWLAPASAEQNDRPFEWAPEFKIGDRFPTFERLDQDGNVQTSSSIQGANGYLILFNRSVVW